MHMLKREICPDPIIKKYFPPFFPDAYVIRHICPRCICIEIHLSQMHTYLSISVPEPYVFKHMYAVSLRDEYIIYIIHVVCVVYTNTVYYMIYYYNVPVER